MILTLAVSLLFRWIPLALSSTSGRHVRKQGTDTIGRLAALVVAWNVLSARWPLGLDRWCIISRMRPNAGK